MFILNDDATLHCDHKMGSIKNKPSQKWVRVADKPVLVKPDPVGRSIRGCANENLLSGIKRCTKTMTLSAGESLFVKIDGRPVCLESVTGLTNGTPAGVVKYSVTHAGQSFVSAAL